MKTCDTYTATIFIAGDVHTIKAVCREFCVRGLCVTITPTDFVFTGGSETGAAIGLINYPRFPSDVQTIRETAILLARELLTGCCQRSCSIVCRDETIYIENPAITVPR